MTHIIKFITEDDKFLNRAAEIKEFAIDGKPQIVSSSSVDLFESSVSLTYYGAVDTTRPSWAEIKGGVFLEGDLEIEGQSTEI